MPPALGDVVHDEVEMVMRRMEGAHPVVAGEAAKAGRRRDGPRIHAVFLKLGRDRKTDA